MGQLVHKFISQTLWKAEKFQGMSEPQEKKLTHVSLFGNTTPVEREMHLERRY